MDNQIQRAKGALLFICVITYLEIMTEAKTRSILSERADY